MGTVERWRAGDPVLLREVFRGRVWAARPATIVEDGPVLVVAYLAPGMRWKRQVGATNRVAAARIARERGWL